MSTQLGPPPVTIKEEYDSVNRGLQFDRRLPIATYRQKILDTVRISPITLIHGATGCGKTTQIPQYILEDCLRRGQVPAIVVTQPRRIAAMSIAQYVCQERGWTLGGLVGYQIGQENILSSDTRVTYCTLGILLQQLVHDKDRLDKITHVILDEVHEREEEMDLALLLLKRYIRDRSGQTYPGNLRLIVMSATMQMEKLVAYLNNPPVIALESGLYEVAVKYLDDIPDHGSALGSFSLDDPYIQHTVTDRLVNLIISFDQLERMNNTSERGSVLVFAPGLREIKNIMKVLEQECQSRRAKWEILPLHSSIANRDQRRIFSPKSGFVRRIIVSTNIAESSITVPDVKYIVDLCLTKQLERRENTSFVGLNLAWASKSNCEQRKGRAGRVSSGICYRLVPKGFYEKLAPHQTPEILRVPLHQTILKVKRLGIAHNIYELLADALDAPEPSDIERSVLELMQAEALTIPEKDSRKAEHSGQRVDGDLTTFGYIMASLPLDIALSRLIILSVCFDCVEEGVIIAACLSSRNFLDTGFGHDGEKYKIKLEWDDGQCSDPLAALAAYNAWNAQKETLFRNSADEERDWCRKYSISWHRINEVAVLVGDLNERVKEFNVSNWYGFRDRNRKVSSWETASDHIDQRLIMQLVIAGAFYPNYFYGTVDLKRPGPKGDAFLDELRCVQLYARVSDPNVISLNGVKAFFHKNIGMNPEDEIRVDDQGTVTVFFPEDVRKYAPKAVYRSLKLRDNREVQKTIEPPRTKIPLLQPRNIRQENQAPAPVRSEVITFTGPVNCLEIREFHGLTKGSDQKVTRLERSSANSVVINSCPQQKMRRWIVAADVTTNAADDKLHLQNTTLLDARPELGALIFLLFTPSATLIPYKEETVDTGKRYVGLRGSLDRGRRLMRDNNVVVYFDTLVHEDLMLYVQSIRNAIHGCFAADLQDVTTRQLKIPGFRKSVRDALHVLLNSDYDFVPWAKNAKHAAGRDAEVFLPDLYPYFNKPLDRM